MIRFIAMSILILWMNTAEAAVINTPFTAPMTSHDPVLWQKSNGWSNGAPFQVGWRSDHISFVNGLLTLKLDNQPGCSSTLPACSSQPYASGEYQSVDLVSYGQVSFRAKATSASGVITGLFLYTGTPTHDEVDIEFLGKDTTQVQFNYFTSGVGNHEFLLPLGFDASMAFHDYMIEWLPNVINWYVDGILKHSVTAGIPTHSQHIFMNLWAATGVNGWSGAFTYTVAKQAQVDLVSYTPASSINRPPVPTAPTITTGSNISGTSQVIAHDPNTGDTHTYTISTAPLHGTASVNTMGMTAYTSNLGYTGSDSFIVTVTDNGTPQKAGSVTIPVTIVDTTAPVITLTGGNTTVTQGTAFTDPGYAASDNVDGNITANVVITGGPVNTAAAVGTVFTLNYNISDVAGNAAAQKTRTVTITASGTTAGGSSAQVGLPTGGTVDIVSIGQYLFGFSATAVNITVPSGVQFPLGKITYTTTSAVGGSQTMSLAFSTPLPANAVLYKIDNAGFFTLIPKGIGTDSWVQINANTAAITLTDGGGFDLDGIVNGVIIDPIAVGAPAAATPANGGGGGCTIQTSAKFDPMMLLILMLSCVYLSIKKRERNTSI